MSLLDPSIVDEGLRASLDDVDALMRSTVASDHPLVSQASVHLIDAGGKRLRPILTMLAGRFGDGDHGDLVRCAAAIELTHLATLYHDDVIDETTVRRGVETVNARYDNHVAVLTGDFLLARASALAAELGPYVCIRLANTIGDLCEGEIIETAGAGSATPSIETYLDVVKRKTASLLASSCHLGAWVAGADDQTVERLTAYGEAVGVAFQLADDVLDVAGTVDDTGKVPGTDLREGVYTLPVLETFAGSVPGAGELRAALDAGEVDRALSILRENGSVERARIEIERWQARATEALDGLAPDPARDKLRSLAGFVGERTG
ncbi:MAG TPA: polyprenyl synthetase family protein [Actinomycetota bacterium]